MPIHINLLAEAQAAEDLRRRDPVKRAIFLGVSLVAIMLVWSGMVWVNAKLANERLTGVQTAIEAHNGVYSNVLANINKIAAAKSKLDALQKLQSARFLQGNLLNALQLSMVDGVQLTRLRVEQSYFLAAAAKTEGDNAAPGRPASVKERVVVSLEARDFSANPGDQVNKFKQTIAGQSYFKAMLDKTNSVELVGVPSLQTGPDGKTFATFTVECHFPDQTR